MFRIIGSSNGSFTPDKLVFGSTISSQYLPIGVLDSVRPFYALELNHVYYNKPDLTKYSTFSYSHNNVLERLNSYNSVYRYKLKQNEDGSYLHIFVCKGFIFDEKGRILLCLAMNPSKRTEIQYQYSYTNGKATRVNTEHFVLFLSHELTNNSDYALLYKKLQRDYLAQALQAETEIRYVSSDKIEELTFSHEFRMNYNTLNQLQEYLEGDIVGQLFNYNFHVGLFYPGLDFSLEERQDKFHPYIPVDIDSMEEQDYVIKLIDENGQLVEAEADLPF